jgi:hypothetical protein
LSTNWVIDNFCLLLESGGNLLTEDGFSLISLQEFDSTVWVEDTDTGNG